MPLHSIFKVVLTSAVVVARSAGAPHHAVWAWSAWQVA